MNWLVRLKKRSYPPQTNATNATKLGFVGFVGSITASIQKIEGVSAAANDLAHTAVLTAKRPVHKLVTTQAPVSIEPAEPPTDLNAWRELAAAYHLHHFNCSTCIAAGRGAVYGLRCGTGAALWNAYQNT